MHAGAGRRTWVESSNIRARALLALHRVGVVAQRSRRQSLVFRTASRGEVIRGCGEVLMFALS
jgi:hypothetical protein